MYKNRFTLKLFESLVHTSAVLHFFHIVATNMSFLDKKEPLNIAMYIFHPHGSFLKVAQVVKNQEFNIMV